MVTGTVHVIDDDRSVLSALRRLLESQQYQVKTYASAREFLDCELELGSACLVLDLELPEMGGLELQELLARKRENPPVVFISGHGDVPGCVRAMKAGAIDFLLKPFDKMQLLSAVDRALARSSEDRVSRETLARSRALFERLTQRERQVCLHVAQGMLNKQIAASFGTTERTIKAQRGRVMEKLSAQSAADIVRLVERLRAAGDLDAPEDKSDFVRV